MSKELKAFKKIKTSWDAEGDKLQDWMDDNDIDIVENGLKRLEAIDNSNPSKALECLDRLDNTLCLNNIKGKLEFGIDTEEHTDCDSVIGMTEDLETIKNALLKQQEPKKYLKWEDLEFTDDKQKIKVKLNGENYTVVYFISSTYYEHNRCEYVGILKDDNIVVYSITCYLSTANLLKQFFNNLHLERVVE